MLSVEGPRDFTGSNQPQQLVHTALGRSFRAVRLLELGEDAVATLWSVAGHVSDMDAVDSELARLMAQGDSLELAPVGGARPRGVQTFDGHFTNQD